MATYTVKKGDTLSAIGKQYGVNYNTITGYRSGNPNLIYPGEVLTIPDKASTVTQQITDTQAKLAAVQAQQTLLTNAGYSQPQYINTQPQYDPAGTIINAANIAPVAENPYVAPNPAPVPDVANLNTATPVLTKTPAEEKAQSLTDELQKLNLSLVGQSEYQTEMNTKYGVDTAQASINDYTAKLNALKADAASIDPRYRLGSAKRGVTTGMLNAQETVALRKNSVEALGVAALLAVAQGSLSTAQYYSDQAVKAKYGQIEEEISAKEKNLQLILASPDATLSDKNRANAMQDKLDQQKEALDKAKTETENIYQIALQAASQGIDSVTVQKIQNAKSLMEATQLAQKAGVFNQTTTATDEVLSPAEAKTLGVAYGTTKAQAAQMGIIPTGTEITTATDEIPTIENTLLKSRGGDGFVDPGVYQKERTKAKMAPSQFDDRFSYLLSPQEKINLGIEKEKTGGDTIDDVWSSL